MRQNNLGWVAEVGDFKSLNSVLVEISKTGKDEIQMMKKQVFDYAEENFDLDSQIGELIKKDVF